MKCLLRFDSLSNQDQGSLRNQSMQKGGDETLGATTQPVNRQCAAILQALNQGPNSGSCRGKGRLPSRTCGMFYQLKKRCSNRSTGQGTGSMLHEVLLHNPGSKDENLGVIFINGYMHPVDVRKSEGFDSCEILDASLAP